MSTVTSSPARKRKVVHLTLSPGAIAALVRKSKRAPLSVASVRQAMRACNGRVPAAAERLGVSRTILWAFLRWAAPEVPRAPRGQPKKKK